MGDLFNFEAISRNCPLRTKVNYEATCERPTDRRFPECQKWSCPFAHWAEEVMIAMITYHKENR